MAWLSSKKRKNPATRRQTTYWSIQWRDERGRTRTRAVGFCSNSEAKTALKVAEAKLALGEAIAPDAPTPSGPSSSAPRTPTLGDYLDLVYLPVVARDKSPKTYAVAENAGKALKTILGDVPLDQITYALVDAYLSERRDLGRKSRTLILELRTLAGALRHACDCEVISAVPKLPRLKDRDRAPARYLTPAESVALLDALRPLDEQPFTVTRGRPPVRRDRATYLAVLMALNTGARRNEILTRTWPDVRWDLGPCGTLIIGAKPEVSFQVKTRRERAVPLTPELRAELLLWHGEQGEPREGWLFPSPKDPSRPRQTFRQALVRACGRAGLHEVHIHGLRHTWASRLAMAGVDRRTLMELGGWTEGRMLDEIYAHVTDEHKAEVMRRMGLTSSASSASAAPTDAP